eukprot:SAG31_NODE_1320_length_8809_cov_4.243398_3_plen_64_part_00
MGEKQLNADHSHRFRGTHADDLGHHCMSDHRHRAAHASLCLEAQRGKQAQHASAESWLRLGHP